MDTTICSSLLVGILPILSLLRGVSSSGCSLIWFSTIISVVLAHSPEKNTSPEEESGSWRAERRGHDTGTLRQTILG